MTSISAIVSELLLCDATATSRKSDRKIGCVTRDERMYRMRQDVTETHGWKEEEVEKTHTRNETKHH